MVKVVSKIKSSLINKENKNRFINLDLLKNYATSKPRQEIYRGGLSQHQLQLAIDYIQAY